MRMDKLPQEIQEGIASIIEGMEDIPFHIDRRYCNRDACKGTMEHLIVKHLKKYLHLPPQQEPKQEIDKIAYLMANYKDIQSELDKDTHKKINEIIDTINHLLSKQRDGK